MALFLQLTAATTTETTTEILTTTTPAETTTGSGEVETTTSLASSTIRGIITACKRSLRRLCFYTCLSFCSQGGVCFSACWDTSPPGADTPPPHARWEIRAKSGRYASCWNAYLYFIKCHKVFTKSRKKQSPDF